LPGRRRAGSGRPRCRRRHGGGRDADAGSGCLAARNRGTWQCRRRRGGGTAAAHAPPACRGSAADGSARGGRKLRASQQSRGSIYWV